MDEKHQSFDNPEAPLLDIDDGPLHVDPTSRRKPGAGFKIFWALHPWPTSLRVHISSYCPISKPNPRCCSKSLSCRPATHWQGANIRYCGQLWQKRYATGDAIRVDSNGKWPMKFKGDLYMELDEDWLYTYNRLDERERVLYSDIVFRGLRLQDKEVHAQLNFQVDLKPFRDSYVSCMDLRASFVIIPSSPSLMDHFQSYNQTSSIDRGFDATRFWSHPFPLGSTDTRTAPTPSLVSNLSLCRFRSLNRGRFKANVLLLGRQMTKMIFLVGGYHPTTLLVCLSSTHC
ncbi:hypothetical protein C8J56DRAFT_939467, partial [Mycena floridula]